MNFKFDYKLSESILKRKIYKMIYVLIFIKWQFTNAYKCMICSKILKESNILFFENEFV